MKREDMVERIWAYVDPSIEGYGDLIRSCLHRMDDVAVAEVLENLSGGDEPTSETLEGDDQ